MDDRQLIMKLGGPTAVAKKLGYDPKGGAQRVQNWMRRGIPSKVKVDHPEMFMRDAKSAAKPNRSAKH
jgi:hypothetical protein